MTDLFEFSINALIFSILINPMLQNEMDKKFLGFGIKSQLLQIRNCSYFQNDNNQVNNNDDTVPMFTE